MMMAGIKPDKTELAYKFAKTIGELMSVANRDGLGYAAVDKDGNLFGERWLRNQDFYRLSSKRAAKIEKMFEKALKSGITNQVTEYTKFGEVKRENTVAMILHTRMATSARGMNNTHPFVYEDTALIHNGVISNEKEFDLKVSTCDSEAILQSYLKNKVGESPTAVQVMAKELVGYYACGVFSRDSEGIRILDVFAGNNSDLNMTYIHELDTWVFASLKLHLEEACKKLGWTHEEIAEVHNGKIIRCNPITGETILIEDFIVGDRTRWINNWPQNNSYNHMGNYQGTTTNTETSRTNNIIPYKGKTISEAMIHYMKQTPSIRCLTDRETYEFIKAQKEA
jgi:hypothetical protein